MNVTGVCAYTAVRLPYLDDVTTTRNLLSTSADYSFVDSSHCPLIITDIAYVCKLLTFYAVFLSPSKVCGYAKLFKLH